MSEEEILFGEDVHLTTACHISLILHEIHGSLTHSSITSWDIHEFVKKEYSNSILHLETAIEYLLMYEYNLGMTFGSISLLGVKTAKRSQKNSTTNGMDSVAKRLLSRRQCAGHHPKSRIGSPSFTCRTKRCLIVWKWGSGLTRLLFVMFPVVGLGLMLCPQLPYSPQPSK